MSASRPEATSEYSRASGARRGSGGVAETASRPLAIAVLAGGLAGAILLLVAEFMPLLQVHSSLHRAPIATLSTGSHDSYALLPIALLTAFFSFVVWRTRSRLGLLATGVLGLVAVLIALIGDLPDAQATGLVGSAASHFAIATSSPAVGFYLETLGAVLLIITSVGGLLLLPAPVPAPRPSRPLRSTPTVGD